MIAAARDAGAPPAPKAAEKPFVPPPATTAGPAHFTTLSGIATILADGRTAVARGSFDHLTLGGDGKAYAAALLSADDAKWPIYRIEGASAKVVARSPEAFSAMAVDRNGHIHVATIGKGVFSYDPATKKWSESPLDISFVDALACDAKGRPWALDRRKVAYLDGASWKHLEPKDSGYFEYQGFALAGTRFFVLGAQQNFEVVNDELVSVGPRFTAGGSHVAGADNGLVVAPDFDSTAKGRSLLVIAPDGASKRFEKRSEDHGLVDSAGRLWTFEDGELAVESLLDGAKTIFPVGTLPLVDEFTGGNMLPKRAIVVGAGPKLPAVGPLRQVTSLTGRITVGGKPVDGATVEICRSADVMDSGGSPCEGRKSQRTATTSSKGEFKFADVPVGRYDLALKKESGRWAVDHLSDIGRMVPGRAVNVGTLRYK